MSDARVSERRIKQRVLVLTEVACRAESTFGFGKSQDISESGLLVVSPETLPLGSGVSVRFVLPVNPLAVMIEAKGKVAWSRPRVCMGIKFVDLKDEYRQAIARYVQSKGSPANT